MGKKVFVVTNVASINTKASSDLLTAGEIGIYAMDTATLKTVRAQTSTVADFFTIALGRGGNLRSDRGMKIDVKPGARELDWFKAAYAAPVKPQIQVSSDCLGASYYDDFMLRVSTRFGGDLSGSEFSAKTYSVTGKFVSATLLYAGLAAKINEDAFADVTATSSSAGVVVTPIQDGVLLDVGFEFKDNQYQPNCTTCLTCDSIITELVVGSDGEGTPRQLKNWLLEARGYRGTIYTDSRDVPLPDDQYVGVVTDASTWDFYFLREKNKNQSIGDHGAVFNVYNDFMIAVPAGTNFAAFTQVIDALIGVPMRTALI